MKKTIYISAVVFIILVSSVTIYKVSRLPRQSADYNLAFSVLGDIHGDTKKFTNALRDLKKINPLMDTLILNGDIVDQGLDKQYQEVAKCLKSNKRLLPGIIIKNMGNHEYYNYDKNTNKTFEPKDFIDRYLAFSGEKSIYHDSWIKGYHFISLGSEIQNTLELNSTAAFISAEQQNWLKSKLSEKYDPGKPIFVFLHQHLLLTTEVNQTRWQGVKQNDEIRDILSKYPEVVMFASHTHQSLEEKNSLIRDNFTFVQTGAVNSPYITDSSGKRGPSEGSQGTYVEVYNDKVVIKGRDFKSKSWIQTANNIVNLK